MAGTSKLADAAASELLRVFRDKGYEGASLTELSTAAGLGRSSLYHHFPGGKEDMASAALEYVDRWVTNEAVATSKEPGTPEQRLAKIIAAIDSFYDGGQERCLLGAFVLGGSGERFQAKLSSIFTALSAALARIAGDAGVLKALAEERAQDSIARIQGALILAAALNDPAPFRRTMAQLPEFLLR